MKVKLKLKTEKAKLQAKTFKFLLLVLPFYFCLFTFDCFAQQPVSSTDLIEYAKELDGKDIIYEGEVVGEVMMRGTHGWINVHDGSSAIGIWVKNDLASKIEYAGSYKMKGDWIKVTGKFNRACKAHGGDLDIHATSIAKINSGRVTEDRPVYEKKRMIVILSGVMLCLLILQLLKKKL